MALDHSLTYRVHSLRNLPHRMRLRAIEREARRLNLGAGLSYADFGCSGGYITERVRRLTRAGRAWGFDHLEAHLARGRRQYPAIEFSLIDLNQPNAEVPPCDFVSCFEMLEHVGNLEAAIGNLLAAIKPGGMALVTVPIEIGPQGIAKFIAKMAYGYSLSELPQAPALFRRYVMALLTGARMSRFRDQRRGWGTHFGFDYRDVDDALWRYGEPFRAWNHGTTRFYCIRRISPSTSPALAKARSSRRAA
jgi:SAM-dependent methyltransferase